MSPMFPTSDGIPSTRINRRSFFVASSISVAERAFDALLYLSRILLNECAVAAAAESVEGAMRGKSWLSNKQQRVATCCSWLPRRAGFSHN